MIAADPAFSGKPGRFPAPLRSGLRVLLFVLLSLLLATACDRLLRLATLVDEEVGLRISTASFVPLAADSGPAPRAAAPSQVSLPYRCPPKHEAWNCKGRFHVVYRHAARPDGEITSLYVPYFSGHLLVHLNGTLLADSFWLQAPSYIGQSAPLLVPLLREGNNEITIVLESELTYGGMLGRLYIDADHRLRSDYRTTRLMVVTLPRLLEGMVIAMAIFMLLIWLVRPRERLYLVFSVMMISWAAPALLPVLVDEPDLTLVRLVNLTRFIFAALALPFAWLFLGRRAPVPVWVFLLLPLAVYLSAFLLPGARAAWLISVVFIPIALILDIATLVVLARAAVMDRNNTALLLLCACVIVVAFTMRDYFVVTGLLQGSHVQLTRFTAPLLAVVMGLTLLGRFAAALGAVERFNIHLRQAVDAAEEKLRQTFAREQEQARKAALEAERVRLMSDLHDGIAGHLVSIISLCEQHNDGQNREIAQASRQALTDLRLVVDSLEDVGGDLGMMLAVFRERIEPQLRRNGIRLDWRVRSLPNLPGLHPAVTLTIFRILQEAASNAAKHSGAQVVEIAAAPSPREGCGVRLTVRDQGRGGAAGRAGGYGMENMHRRAEAIGAVLTVDSTREAGGTTVILDLPARLEEAVAATG